MGHALEPAAPQARPLIDRLIRGGALAALASLALALLALGLALYRPAPARAPLDSPTLTAQRLERTADPTDTAAARVARHKEHR